MVPVGLARDKDQAKRERERDKKRERVAGIERNRHASMCIGRERETKGD
jgi:hypothetical protein